MQAKLLPAEFRSGNDIPVMRSTIRRERMMEIIGEVSQALLPDDVVALLTSEVARLTEMVDRLESEKRQANAQDHCGEPAITSNAEPNGDESSFNKELADVAMRFVDRAGDYCKEDPAERICDQFHLAVADVVDKYCAMRGMPSAKYGRDGKLKPQPAAKED